MPRIARATSLLAFSLLEAWSWGTSVPRLQAAGPPAISRGPASSMRGAARTAASNPPDRALVDQYCVTCHNERLKTANLLLDKVDLANVSGNQEVLEKIVRKLRAGLMPPEGRPRPDAASLASFTGS
jgi:cytochrome c5